MGKYALIGYELSYSLSKRIHNVINDNYDLVELKSDNELKEFIQSKRYDGFNVTIPYKEDIIKYLDKIDEEAKNIGAVNTVVKTSDGEYIGYNTDIYGMEVAIKNTGIKIKGNNFLILGTGGTSKTARYLLNREKANKVYIAGRNSDINYDNVYEKCKDVDYIINTTPIGMNKYFGKTLLDITRFSNISGVFDRIYNPIHTKLVLDAKENNIKASNGLMMLIYQAIKAEELFLNIHIDDVSKFIKLEHDLKKEFSNIVFLGIAGAGKSVIGKAFAKKTKRQYFDTDEEIVKKEVMTIDQIFKLKGEEYFRKIEREIIENLSKMNNIVISLGGGAPIDKRNRDNLKLNGILVQIQRDFNLIETSGRPLYKSKSPEELYSERKDIYDGFTDIYIKNDKSVIDAVNMLIREIDSYEI